MAGRKASSGAMPLRPGRPAADDDACAMIRTVTTAPDTTVNSAKAKMATKKASRLNLKKPCGSVSSWIRFNPANKALKPRCAA